MRIRILTVASVASNFRQPKQTMAQQELPPTPAQDEELSIIDEDNDEEENLQDQKDAVKQIPSRYCEE